MLEFITFLIKELVNYPESVEISTKEEDGGTTYVVNVHPEDMPLIIGKGGRTIKGLRNLARAKAIKDHLRVNIELQDNLNAQI